MAHPINPPCLLQLARRMHMPLSAADVSVVEGKRTITLRARAMRKAGIQQGWAVSLIALSRGRLYLVAHDPSKRLPGSGTVRSNGRGAHFYSSCRDADILQAVAADRPPRFCFMGEPHHLEEGVVIWRLDTTPVTDIRALSSKYRQEQLK